MKERNIPLFKEVGSGDRRLVPAIRTGYFHIGVTGEEESMGAHYFQFQVFFKSRSKKVTDLRRYQILCFYIPELAGTENEQINIGII